MAVRRDPMQATQYVQVPNHWLRDPRLSLHAKGLLAYLKSHDENYDLAISQILKQNRDGKTAVRSAVKELENVGYLRRHRERKHGRWCQYDYQIVEFPQVDTRADFLPQQNGGRNTAAEDRPLRRPAENTNEERSSRDEEDGGQQPHGGEGRGTRKGTPEIDAWSDVVVVLPGEGLNGTRWADRFYERE